MQQTYSCVTSVPIWSAAVDGYLSTDAAYLKQDSGAKREDGCTAVTVILYQQQMVVANVGDSRAVLCRNGKGEQPLQCRRFFVWSVP